MWSANGKKVRRQYTARINTYKRVSSNMCIARNNGDRKWVHRACAVADMTYTPLYLEPFLKVLSLVYATANQMR